jgi:hypothetical protein
MMATKRGPARSIARRRNNNSFWLDHAEIVEEDYDWLASVEQLTLWNVEAPAGFLGRLEKLWWLDVRGGSSKDLKIARGATWLQYLAVNQVRGLQDLSVVGEMVHLRYIDLYGLPRVETLPSFACHGKLARASLGQMKGLQSLEGLLQAPGLQELLFSKKMNVSIEDIERIKKHQTLKEFSWFAEDVPVKDWLPVVQKIGLPEARVLHPEEWFGLSDLIGR